MSNPNSAVQAGLPDYLKAAKANPMANRAPWYKNTAPTYAGIFLWFVFWTGGTTCAPNLGGVLSQGIWTPILGLVLAALLCHMFYYVVLGLMGQKTGLPLYIVGTSTFGASGGFIMPGFLMGVLQFGWLGVNIFYSSLAILAINPDSLKGHAVPFNAMMVMIAWGVLAAFVGLKGIQYVAKVATYLPLIPLATLLTMFAMTAPGLAHFDVAKFSDLHKSVTPTAPMALTAFGVVAAMITFVVGFFATAGAAGVDFGTGSRDERDVHMGGGVGIFVAIVFTAGMGVLILAGAAGKGIITPENFTMNPMELIKTVLGTGIGKVVLVLLAISAFPSACFSSLIAANSFKTTLSKVNPFVSVGIGAAVSILLAVTKWAGDLGGVFQLIGASFGPICGAMAVDYMLNGCKWAGPRKGFNPAGWLAWAFGFTIGIMPVGLTMAPVWAMIVGAVIYFLAAKAGLQSPVLAMPGVAQAVEEPAMA
jgi:cytosine permease